MIYAPIYIPTLCRYEHFKQCIESLAQCDGASETEVYVALDYPAKESHLEGYEKIKTYLEGREHDVQETACAYAREKLWLRLVRQFRNYARIYHREI